MVVILALAVQVLWLYVQLGEKKARGKGGDDPAQRDQV